MRKILSYVSYYDLSFARYENVFLVGQDTLEGEKESRFFYVNTFCFDWLVYLDKKEWIWRFDNYYSIPETWFKYKLITDEQVYLPKNRDWAYQFPILEDDVVYMKNIAYFFEQLYKNFHKTKVKKLETAITLTKKEVPKELMKRMVHYTVFNGYFERKMETIFSKEIQEYI